MVSGPVPVSVVIPTYNRAHTIERCLASILGQTAQPAEILVVDDGSLDQTVAMASQVAPDRIRVLRLSAHGGAQQARNRGIEESSQEWIAFLDSDDQWLPDRLSEQWQALQSRGASPTLVAHCDCMIQTGERQTHLHLPLVDGPDSYASVLSRPSPMFQGLLVHKHRLLDIGMLDTQVPSFQEWETAIRLARVANFVHVRRPLFVYHRHDGSTISASSARNHAGYEYVIRKHEAEIRRVAGPRAWNLHLLRQAELAVSLGDVTYLAELPPRFAGPVKPLLGALLRLATLEQRLSTILLRKGLRLLSRIT